jgi:hypothetical protein
MWKSGHHESGGHQIAVPGDQRSGAQAAVRIPFSVFNVPVVPDAPVAPVAPVVPVPPVAPDAPVAPVAPDVPVAPVASTTTTTMSSGVRDPIAHPSTATTSASVAPTPMSGVTSGVRHSAPTSILQTIETSAAETARMIAERVAQNLIVETEWIASENLLREEQATDDEGWQITNRAVIFTKTAAYSCPQMMLTNSSPSSASSIGFLKQETFEISGGKDIATQEQLHHAQNRY